MRNMYCEGAEHKKTSRKRHKHQSALYWVKCLKWYLSNNLSPSSLSMTLLCCSASKMRSTTKTTEWRGFSIKRRDISITATSVLPVPSHDVDTHSTPDVRHISLYSVCRVCAMHTRRAVKINLNLCLMLYLHTTDKMTYRSTLVRNKIIEQFQQLH